MDGPVWTPCIVCTSLENLVSLLFLYKNSGRQVGFAACGTHDQAIFEDRKEELYERFRIASQVQEKGQIARGEFASEGLKTASDGDNKRPGTAPDGVRCVVCEPLENWMKSFRKKVKEDNGEPGELEFPICLWHRGQKTVVHARMVETLVEIKKMDFGRKIRLGVTGDLELDAMMEGLKKANVQDPTARPQPVAGESKPKKKKKKTPVVKREEEHCSQADRIVSPHEWIRTVDQEKELKAREPIAGQPLLHR